MAKYSLFKVIYTNWGKDISEHHLGCCTLTMVQSKNVSSPSCIYSAFHCLCLSAIPIKMSNISIFFFFTFACLCVPGISSASFYRPHLAWQGYTGGYTPVHSLSCKYASKKVSTRWGEGREGSGKAPSTSCTSFFFFSERLGFAQTASTVCTQHNRLQLKSE